ncbi:discoidin domain-containing protein [Streptomyces roseoverticillatus]|uniref:discoidin domain-containing protein n=1 Tax=Streptomyces roseoverticillatus TaxID=66429 RepID=UPI0027E3F864|nr:discoidin domain-containing protein [Streptomyces roseoverticillatus]
MLPDLSRRTGISRRTGLFRLSRLRSQGLVLLALVAVLVAFLPVLGTRGGGAAAEDVDARRSRPHHAAAPASAMEPAAPVLSRAGWTATASDEETAQADNRAANVLDGKADTLWHSRWSADAAPFPHSLVIDMHRTEVVSALLYQPRADGANGRIGEYAIHLSADGQNWGAAVASGTLADDSTTKTLSFAARGTRFVRLTATSEAGNRGPWSSAAEIQLLGDPGLPASVVELPTTGWTASASDEETAQADNRAANVLDGDADTLWHSRWSANAAPLPHSVTIDMHRTQTVSALTYQPRKSGANGRIGAYSVATSLDGLSFGTPVAGGVWKDDDTVKSTTFTRPTPARFVRLTATTEAGNRGPWSSAAEIRLSGPADPAVSGTWDRVTGFPLVPVATAVLPNNKLLAWSAYAIDRFGGSNGYTQTAIMDLGTGQVTQRRVDNTGHDMFCPGIAMLADGRVLVTGGSNASRASIYDPRTDTWSATGEMNIPRGYQAMTLLSNGDAFVLGGSWSGARGDKDGEVWSPATGKWRKLPGVPAKDTLTADPAGPYRADNHQWLHATSRGRVLQLGPSKQMNWIDTTGNGTITPAGTRADSPDAMNGNAVSYDIGKLLTLGGATAYENVNAGRRAYTVDLGDGARPVSKRTGDMGYARSFSNSVVLPDGKVAVFGGQSYPVPFSDATSVMTPELWDPATGAFTKMASMAVPRNYHSVANLLPDGRIFSGGGGLCGDCATNHSDGAIFTPPYLLNPDGTRKARPAFTSTPPARVANGASLPVTTDKPVAAFALVRAGAATHSVDNDQRRVPLTFRQTDRNPAGGTSYELKVPDDPGVALPGTYMLFALDAAGVPGIAKMITIG